MIAEQIMVKEPVTARVDEKVDAVLERMRARSLRMLPVVDGDGCIQGVISTFSVLEHVVPDYIVSGDLESLAYAPDLGILGRDYVQVTARLVNEVMDAKPLVVGPSESLLSVTAALISYGKHEYALVADKQKRLLGVISAGDILDQMLVTVKAGLPANA